MGQRFEARKREAMALRDRLRVEGRHDDAAILHRLILSAVSASGTCRRLHGENVEYRRRLGLETFPLAEGEG